MLIRYSTQSPLYRNILPLIQPVFLSWSCYHPNFWHFFFKKILIVIFFFFFSSFSKFIIPLKTDGLMLSPHRISFLFIDNVVVFLFLSVSIPLFPNTTLYFIFVTNSFDCFFERLSQRWFPKCPSITAHSPRTHNHSPQSSTTSLYQPLPCS